MNRIFYILQLYSFTLLSRTQYNIYCMVYLYIFISIVWFILIVYTVIHIIKKFSGTTISLEKIHLQSNLLFSTSSCVESVSKILQT